MTQLNLHLRNYKKTEAGALNFFAGVYEIHKLKGHAVTYSRSYAECYSCKLLYMKHGRIIRKTKLTY